LNFRVAHPCGIQGCGFFGPRFSLSRWAVARTSVCGFSIDLGLCGLCGWKETTQTEVCATWPILRARGVPQGRKTRILAAARARHPKTQPNPKVWFARSSSTGTLACVVLKAAPPSSTQIVLAVTIAKTAQARVPVLLSPSPDDHCFVRCGGKWRRV
jgi:hypothetical protein